MEKTFQFIGEAAIGFTHFSMAIILDPPLFHPYESL